VKGLKCRTKHHRGTDDVCIDIYGTSRPGSDHLNFEYEAIMVEEKTITVMDLRKFVRNHVRFQQKALMICSGTKIKGDASAVNRYDVGGAPV